MEAELCVSCVSTARDDVIDARSSRGCGLQSAPEKIEKEEEGRKGAPSSPSRHHHPRRNDRERGGSAVGGAGEGDRLAKSNLYGFSSGRSQREFASLLFCPVGGRAAGHVSRAKASMYVVYTCADQPRPRPQFVDQKARTTMREAKHGGGVRGRKGRNGRTDASCHGSTNLLIFGTLFRAFASGGWLALPPRALRVT